MYIYIKNMVCNRCILVVSQIFDEAGITIENIQLGKVKTYKQVDPDKLEQLNNKLKSVDFEIINDSKRRLIEKIKNITINYVYHHTGETKMNFSEYLTDRLNLDYSY